MTAGIYPEFMSVVSSNIAGVARGQDDESLYIEFRSGGVYKYAGAAEEYEGVLNGGGSYFHNNVRDSYPAVRV